PEGFAHGFVTLTETAEFLYKTTNYYAPVSDRGIAWNDASIGIKWPELNADILTSAKDSTAKSLATADLFI
ncbi:dTDP-4-dehydrorhamnose 3,5-epimerase family protein, partial [Aeromonas sp. 700722]